MTWHGLLPKMAFNCALRVVVHLNEGSVLHLSAAVGVEVSLRVHIWQVEPSFPWVWVATIDLFSGTCLLLS